MGIRISSATEISTLIVRIITRERIIIIGALASSLTLIIYASCTFVISVVSLVTRLEVEKWSMFLNEKSCIL